MHVQAQRMRLGKPRCAASGQAALYIEGKNRTHMGGDDFGVAGDLGQASRAQHRCIGLLRIASALQIEGHLPGIANQLHQGDVGAIAEQLMQGAQVGNLE